MRTDGTFEARRGAGAEDGDEDEEAGWRSDESRLQAALAGPNSEHWLAISRESLKSKIMAQ